MDTRKNFTRTTLRIPQELYDRLAEATENKRSVNAEIISRLEASFSAKDSIPLDGALKIFQVFMEDFARNWPPKSGSVKHATLLGGPPDDKSDTTGKE